MVNKKRRKIFKSGNSKAIALPVDWVKGHENLKSVEILYDGSVIVVIPEGFPEKKRQRIISALEEWNGDFVTKDDLKEIGNSELLAYLIKLIESGCKPESRERRLAKEELSGRLERKTRYVTEKSTLNGQPVNILIFSEAELEILEDLTSEGSSFYEKKVTNPIHQKILCCLEALRRNREELRLIKLRTVI